MDKLLFDNLLYINDNEIHFWVVKLSDAKYQYQRLKSYLTKDELNKKNSFYFSKDKYCFAIGHGALRMLLGYYTGISPKKLIFYNTFNGKPELYSKQNKKDISFNLSHSDDLIVLGFSNYRNIGVDVERIRIIDEYLDIVEHYFNEKEKKLFQNYSFSQGQENFFKLWTKKEAFVKATGEGLSRSLKSFSIYDNQIYITNDNKEGLKKLSWKVFDIDVFDDYACSIVVEV